MIQRFVMFVAVVSGMLLTLTAQSQEPAKKQDAAAAESKEPAKKQDAAASESKGYKMGVVNRKTVFDSYARAKTEYEKLQKEVDSRQKDVDSLSAQIDAAKKQFDEKRDAMSETERDEAKAKIESDYRQYKSEMMRRQSDIDSMEARVVKRLFGEIDRAVARVAEEGNYHLVLDGTQKDTPGTVIYFSTTLDITQKVVDFINANDMSVPE